MEKKLTDEQKQMLTEFWKSIILKIESNDLSQVGHSTVWNIIIKKGSKAERVQFEYLTQVVVVKKQLITNDILMLILKVQPYYLGLCPSYQFYGPRTSGYAFDYERMRNYEN
jgi:hypothetical protein